MLMRLIHCCLFAADALPDVKGTSLRSVPTKPRVSVKGFPRDESLGPPEAVSLRASDGDVADVVGFLRFVAGGEELNSVVRTQVIAPYGRDGEEGCAVLGEKEAFSLG